jgi:hypothetical protein
MAASYVIRVRGAMGERERMSFDGFAAEVEPAETVLRGMVADQSALHGLLERLQALGLELVGVRNLSDHAS